MRESLGLESALGSRAMRYADPFAPLRGSVATNCFDGTLSPLGTSGTTAPKRRVPPGGNFEYPLPSGLRRGLSLYRNRVYNLGSKDIPHLT
jgi:hypothetical protein